MSGLKCLFLGEKWGHWKVRGLFDFTVSQRTTPTSRSTSNANANITVINSLYYTVRHRGAQREVVGQGVPSSDSCFTTVLSVIHRGNQRRPNQYSGICRTLRRQAALFYWCSHSRVVPTGMKRFSSEFLRCRVRSRAPPTSTAGSFKSSRSSKLLQHSTVTFHSIGPALATQLRSFSATAAATSSAQTTAQANKKKDDSNIFLDNLGKIFLFVIGGIIATLIRSSRSTVNRNAIRDMIEEISAIDPVEIDELRLANSELQPPVYRTIVRDLVDRYPNGSCSYNEFIMTTRTTMAGLKGGAFTIQLGHLVDRVVAEILTKYGQTEDDPLPLSLWLTTLALPLSSSVDERIDVIFEALELLNSGSPIMIKQVEDVVRNLQDTCQLPAETQIVPTEEQFPTQQWTRGSAEQLVPWERSATEHIDRDAFSAILRTKSVCAWGECYNKKKM